MNPVIMTQSRIGNTRFPGKALKKVHGKTLLQMHVERLQPLLEVQPEASRPLAKVARKRLPFQSIYGFTGQGQRPMWGMALADSVNDPRGSWISLDPVSDPRGAWCLPDQISGPRGTLCASTRSTTHVGHQPVPATGPSRFHPHSAFALRCRCTYPSCGGTLP